MNTLHSPTATGLVCGAGCSPPLGIVQVRSGGGQPLRVRQFTVAVDVLLELLAGHYEIDLARGIAGLQGDGPGG